MNHFFIFANERWEISKAEQPALLPTTSLISPRKGTKEHIDSITSTIQTEDHQWSAQTWLFSYPVSGLGFLVVVSKSANAGPSALSIYRRTSNWWSLYSKVCASETLLQSSPSELIGAVIGYGAVGMNLAFIWGLKVCRAAFILRPSSVPV